MNTTSLKTVWETLWKDSNTEDGKNWDSIDKLEEPKDLVPSEKTKANEPPAHEVPVQLEKPPSERSGWNALQAKQVFLPDDLEKEIEEAFMTPDAGMSVLGRSLYTGAAVEPGNTYDRNFCPDPPAPEESESWQDQDQGGTIIAPKRFVPRESLNHHLASAMAWEQRQRKLRDR